MTATAPSLPAITSAVSAARAFETALCASFQERHRVIRGLMLAMIAGEHILLLGPPGTAKSALALALSEATGWRSFVRLMGAQTLPEELFGPFDLSGLSESPSRFERVVDGYLPTAQVAFLDEIFKANSAILNSLLTALNERCYDNGKVRLSLPLELAIGASNEYPQDETLSALYDRFMMRYWVDYIHNDSAFIDMLLAPEVTVPALDTAHIQVLRSLAATVTVPRQIGEILADIRHELAKDHGISASDRRWRKSIRIMQASAALDGRSVVRASDLGVLPDILWNKHEERDAINAVVITKRHPELAKVSALRERAEELASKLPDLNRVSTKDITSLSAALDELQTLGKEAKEIWIRSGNDPDVDEERKAMMAIGNRIHAALNKAAGGGSFSME
jgi:MoxR-like ATPase